MTRTEDVEERKGISELLTCISDYPGCLNTIFFGLANEFISFINNNRTHIGLEEILKVVLVVIRKRSIAYEDMVVFHYQVILGMIRTRFCGESKEISNVIKAICRNYPELIPLTIKHFKKVFGEVWSNTKVVIVHAMGETFSVMGDEMYLCLENEICELIGMSFDSNHHLVIEDMAEILLLNYRSILRHKETFVPKVFEPIYRASQKFWRIEGVNKILRILHAILEMDCRLFERCLKAYNVKRWRNRWKRESSCS
ncbi:Ser/Thr protein phosphatase 2A regulatory subunit beta [Encephalitozoon romaleae SJ-2008]|uniref:Ser/Thr protein phosphatase 2A regulatory subunit beta n=1 Tax=Encephalitozoon romaleae (strain SJ-2008) TaxID=1178016 RepID=I6ZT42_ENCRO|nr:Ser/Thr protein phosphatase 2A regulatory subunit beta [Encephalitozoon romaleae SJ-2008]AFN82786.1 Ser/Thr protein phosphatase 2A regulatory subunit beta [Encephalitozoon romaleae SJ-2008]